MRKRKGKTRARLAAAHKPAQKPKPFGLRHVDDRAAVFVFLVFLVVVFFILDAIADQQARLKGGDAKKVKVLTRDVAERDILSKLVIDSKEQDGTGFIVKDNVDPELLEHFASKSYEQVKAELGVDADFVIHFEDMDGNVIPIGDRMCVGSKGASINGVPCS